MFATKNATHSLLTQGSECCSAKARKARTGFVWSLVAAAPLAVSTVFGQMATPLPTPAPMQSVPQYSAPGAPTLAPPAAPHIGSPVPSAPQYNAPAPQYSPSPTPQFQPAPTYSAPSTVVPYGRAPIDATILDRVPLLETADDVSGIEYDTRVDDVIGSDRELELIYHRSQLIRTNKRIRRIQVTDPRTVSYIQYTPTELTVIGEEFGTTDMAMWFEDEEEPLMYSVRVIRDPELEDQRREDYGRIERKIALLYPNSKVYLIPLSQKIIVRGQASDTKEAANIMQIVRGEVINRDRDRFGGQNGYGGGYGGGGGYGNGFNDPNNFNNNNGFSSFIVDELEVPGEFQVMVRVRIAELSRSQLRSYGVNWSYLFDNGAQSIASTLTGNAPVLSGLFNDGDITVLLNALAANGTVKVMEDSVLTVLSGDSASFLSGGEFAVPTTVGLGGAAAATTTFRGFGVSVIATPTVVDRDLIRMQIVPELSSISGGNAVGGVPGLNVNRVQTRVELREGQTIVLGGLFSRQQQTEVARIPLLGEIPVIGKLLFNTKNATEDEKEMLIIVTPEIVRPMDPEDVPPMPGFYVTHPDDFDFFEYNRTEGDPDLGHYRVMPIGRASGYGQDQGYTAAAPATAGGGGGIGDVMPGQEFPIQGGPQMGAPVYGPPNGAPMNMGIPNYNQQLPPMAPPIQYGPMTQQQQPQQGQMIQGRRQPIRRVSNQAVGPRQQIVPTGGWRTGR